MAATIHGTSGLTFGNTTETGGYLQNIDVRNSIEKTEVRNEQGEFVGVAQYNRTEEISGEFIPFGSTGLAAAAPAAVLTLASYTPAAGIILVEELSTKHTNTGFHATTFKSFVYPLITS
jgi:hypothetical protein